MYHIQQTLKVNKIVTQDEINKGLFKEIQKDVMLYLEINIFLEKNVVDDLQLL